VQSCAQDLGPRDWQTLVETRAIDAAHPMLGGDDVYARHENEGERR
jgi:hypothetical protein